MFNYLLRKALILLIALFAVITLTFFLMHSLPGNPFVEDQAISEEILQALQHQYGLDQPLLVQYGRYLKSVIHLDLGPSIKYQGRTVSQIIREGFPVSFVLGIQSLIMAILGGLTLGILACLYRLRGWAQFILVLTTLGLSIPSFLLATFFQYFLAMQLDWFPVARWGSFSHTILPSLTLAIFPLSFIALLVRSSLLKILQQDYILTAKSKGLNNLQVIWRHALRNALMPIIAYLGPLIATIFMGSFVIEKIFGIPGLGQWLVVSITNRDYPVIVGISLFYSVLLMLCNFLVDALYCLIDPGIKYYHPRVFYS